MYKKNEIVYSDAFKHLKNKETGTISFSSFGNEDDFDELEVDTDAEIVEISNDIFLLDNKFALCVNGKEYGEIKSSIVKIRYSNDDQIAIMLNREDSPEKELEYQRMQEWRDFASCISKKISAIC